MSPAWRLGSSGREMEFERPHPWLPTWLPPSNARRAAPSTQNSAFEDLRILSSSDRVLSHEEGRILHRHMSPIAEVLPAGSRRSCMAEEVESEKAFSFPASLVHRGTFPDY
jgi:hypothetical protein